MNTLPLEPFALGHLPVATTVLAVAYLIRGITGFGSGLMAIPLLALILPLPVVVPVTALLDFLASITHGVGNRQVVKWREIVTQLPFSLLGIVLSILVLKTLDPDILRQALAVFIIVYALYHCAPARHDAKYRACGRSRGAHPVASSIPYSGPAAPST